MLGVKITVMYTNHCSYLAKGQSVELNSPFVQLKTTFVLPAPVDTKVMLNFTPSSNATYNVYNV